MFNNITYKLIALFAVVLLAGCASTGTLVTTNIKTVVVDTPPYLLQKCSVRQPPDIKTYMAADMSGREGMLSDYINSLLLDMSDCNTQLSNIKAFQDKQDALYGK